jgi:hypothetical protein
MMPKPEDLEPPIPYIDADGSRVSPGYGTHKKEKPVPKRIGFMPKDPQA